MIAQPLFTALLVSFVATPLAIALYRKLGMVDAPSPARPMTTHEAPVPRGGGIPLLVGLLAGLLVALRLDQHLLGVLSGATIIVAIGVLDDRYNLNPYLRLALLFGAAAAVVGAGIGIPYINLPFLGTTPLDQPRLSFWLLGKERELWVVADVFALVWIVGVMNFVNWAKGLDGQLPGVVVIAAATVAVLSLRFSADITQWPVIILAAATAGAYLGFLPWNFYPQKIMPGFGGGALGGYLLAVMSILSTTKVGTLLVVLGIPLVDAGYTIIRRLAAGRSPVWGDRGHLHHHLLDDLGWSKRRIALFYWGVTGLLGAIALQLNSTQKFYTMLTVALVLGGTLLWLRSPGLSSRRHDRSAG